MNYYKFLELCGDWLIDPSLAMENERVIKALKDRVDLEAMKQIFLEEF